MEGQHKSRKLPVSIMIRGAYDVGENEPMETELVTEGFMYKLNGHWYVSYTETETTGYDGCITTLKVGDRQGQDDPVVTLTRKGSASSHLIMQQGERTLGSYHVYGNAMEIGVYTKDLEYSFDEAGGRLHLHYTLDMNANLLSENELTIEVTPV